LSRHKRAKKWQKYYYELKVGFMIEYKKKGGKMKYVYNLKNIEMEEISELDKILTKDDLVNAYVFSLKFPSENVEWVLRTNDEGNLHSWLNEIKKQQLDPTSEEEKLLAKMLSEKAPKSSFKFNSSKHNTGVQQLAISGPTNVQHAQHIDRKSFVMETTRVDDIIIGERIGGGNFGDVYRGKWQSTVEVALKKLKKQDQVEEFVAETNMLRNLKAHPNIVRFIGTYVDNENADYLVTEFCPYGSLNQFLFNRDEDFAEQQLVGFALDCSAGMQFLESSKIVHRDLSARNLLVSMAQGRYSALVSDFGMSRLVSNDYYATQNSLFPVKWSSPESITNEKFTHKSDVWSFGITCWEIFELGAIPYYGKTNQEVVTFVVKENGRLNQPKRCPDEMFTIMMECWESSPKDRPDFNQITKKLAKLIAKKSKSVEKKTELTDSTYDVAPSNEMLTSSIENNEYMKSPENQQYVLAPTIDQYSKNPNLIDN